jgi:hypothetical protein
MQLGLVAWVRLLQAPSHCLALSAVVILLWHRRTWLSLLAGPVKGQAEACCGCHLVVGRLEQALHSTVPATAKRLDNLLCIDWAASQRRAAELGLHQDR